MNAMQFHLKRLGACRSVLKWASTQDNPNHAWTTCPRGNWLLCAAVKLGVEHRVVVLAACACARLALPFTDDERPLHAILMTEHWVQGDDDVTVEDMKRVAKECDDAALDAGCYGDHAGPNAAYAAMYAAISALPGQTPQGAADAAASAAVEAAADAAINPTDARLARMLMHRTCAKVVRSHINEDTIMQAWWEHVTHANREDQPCTH
jgi:hypothetical protein